MSKWVGKNKYAEKTKKPLRLKARIKLLRRYSRHVGEAYERLAKAKIAITRTVNDYRISPEDLENNKSCMYKLNEPNKSSVENPGMIVLNDCFDASAVCTCTDCPKNPLNVEYFAAEKQYDDAINAKWDWIFGRTAHRVRQ